jgi:hypothetical protein
LCNTSGCNCEPDEAQQAFGYFLPEPAQAAPSALELLRRVYQEIRNSGILIGLRQFVMVELDDFVLVAWLSPVFGNRVVAAILALTTAVLLCPTPSGELKCYPSVI